MNEPYEFEDDSLATTYEAEDGTIEVLILDLSDEDVPF